MLKYLWPLAGLTALALFVSWQGHLPYPNPVDDAYRYVAMAQQPFGSPNAMAHNSPFAWRLLTPLLVHLLPLSIFDGFWLITLLGLAGAALALIWFLRGIGLPKDAAVAGGLTFIFLLPATGFTLYDDKLVDPLAFALLTLALAACVHRLGPLMFISLVLCALDKETALLGTLFAVAWAWQQRDLALLCWAIASLMSVLALLVLIRALVPASPYDLGTILLYDTIGSLVYPMRLVLALVGAWGILLPLAFASRWLWGTSACWLFWLAATAQVFVSHDIERVVVYAFPVMIAASCTTIETLAKRWHVARWWLWVVVWVLELTWTYTYGPRYIFTLAPLSLPLMALLLVAALLIVGIRISQWLSPRFHSLV